MALNNYDVMKNRTVFYYYIILYSQIKMEQLNINDGTNANDPNNQNDLQKMITENLQGGDINNRKIFSYQDKAPAAPEFHQNPLRVVYSVKTPMSTKSGTRFIPSSPDRILDAPDIINDYCMCCVVYAKLIRKTEI